MKPSAPIAAMKTNYSGPLPTIADSKRLGMTGFRVECATLYCHHAKRIEFEALGLPDDAVISRHPKATFRLREMRRAAGDGFRGLERILRRHERVRAQRLNETR
jgi:hypothetical protein